MHIEKSNKALNKLSMLVAISIATVSMAATAENSIKIAQELEDPEPFRLVINILEEAVERYGEGASVEWVPAWNMNQSRSLHTLESCTTDYDVVFTGYHKDREEKFLQVNVPLTLGLLGVRGMVVNAEKADELRPKAAQLQEWAIGSGTGWPDTEIMEKNGYQITDNLYNNLWTMLEKNRIDAFQRGVQESQMEIQQRGENFVLLDNVNMIYPLDFMAYVSPCKPDLHAKLENILQQAFDDGLIMEKIQEDPSSVLALDMLRNPDVQKFGLENHLTTDKFDGIISQYFLPEIKEVF